MKPGSYTPSGELRHFVDRLILGESLSRTESAQLEGLLEDDDALAYFVSSLQQDELLPLALEGIKLPEDRISSRRGWAMRAIWVAAAASVVFIAGYHFGNRNAPTQNLMGSISDDSNAPRLTGLVGVEWEPGSEPDLIGGDRQLHNLAFRSGLAEVTYGNGVRVTLQGPVDFSITGPKSARLNHGRFVAHVPRSAEGFRVDYEGGSIVDLGTEFGLDLSPAGEVEVGVFDGEIELHRPHEETLSLLANQALLVAGESGQAATSIPLNRTKFVRRIPSRDFRWEMDRIGPVTVEYDVSHLVWKASDYRAIFKWMQGEDGVSVRNVSLCLDGEPVVTSPIEGATGSLHNVRDNVFPLSLPPSEYKRGVWTVQATLENLPLAEDRDLESHPIGSIGIMLFEEGLVSSATEKDFVGTWDYNYDGLRYQRHFHADGTITMSINGRLITGKEDYFSDSRWWVNQGILHLSIPKLGLNELHVLRDADTLIFVNNPYENATRSKTSAQ
ncbi:MAG: FecR family protein [Akkermansiaceae bacterium]|jgi:hypothetical protein|nr:FecR family protein [Akkermansiaceae bacterium]